MLPWVQRQDNSGSFWEYKYQVSKKSGECLIEERKLGTCTNIQICSSDYSNYLHLYFSTNLTDIKRYISLLSYLGSLLL